MLKSSENAKNPAALENVFVALDTRLRELQERIGDHDELMSRLQAGSETSSVLEAAKTNKHGAQNVDDPIYLWEIRDYVAKVVDSMKELKKAVEMERKDTEAIVTSYQVQRITAACFASLEKLDLSGLEVQIQEFKKVDPANGLIPVFQKELQLLEKAHDEISEDKWRHLKDLGKAAGSGHLPPEKLKQLMEVIADHTNISIFSQWYQLSRVELSQRAAASLLNFGKYAALNRAIQAAHKLSSQNAEYPEGESKSWDVIEQLEEGFHDEGFLASLTEADRGFVKQWQVALRETVDRIMNLEEKRRVLSKKRRGRWHEYLDSRIDYLEERPLGTAGSQQAGARDEQQK